MSTKQDRAAARTATDLERKYNFGKSFAEVFGLAKGAQDAAARAEDAADKAQEAVGAIDHEAVFNLLTNNGEIQGIYKSEDGQIYINASYIMAGILDADLVTVKNLIAEKLKSVSDSSEVNIDGAILNFLWSGLKTMEFCNTGEGGFPIIYMTDYQNDVAVNQTEVTPHHIKVGGTSATPAFVVDIQNGKTRIGVNDGKGSMFVAWKDNGDGTFSLVGTYT